MRTTTGERWSRPAEPLTGLGWGSFGDVDCVTASSCTAVGSETDFTTPWHRTLVARTTDGRAWYRVPSPNPAPRRSGAVLGGVSFTSTTNCVAVGNVFPTPGDVERAFILQTTDGNTWTRAPTPVATAPVGLADVSCSSTVACTAVGIEGSVFDSDVSVPTILRTTNGARWYAPGSLVARVGRTPRSVSCPLPTRCVAVGRYLVDPPTTVPFRSLILEET
jgi:hypothetical protein